MSNRLMSDRDHIENLVGAAENLLRRINQADPKTSMEIQIRLASAVRAARDDLG